MKRVGELLGMPVYEADLLGDARPPDIVLVGTVRYRLKVEMREDGRWVATYNYDVPEDPGAQAHRRTDVHRQ